jgi:hypothetical protein
VIPEEALSAMPCAAVMQAAHRLSGLSLEEIAFRMERDEATVAGWFAEEADRFPPLPLLPKLCHILDNTIIFEWVFAQFQGLQTWSGHDADVPGQHRRAGEGFQEIVQGYVADQSEFRRILGAMGHVIREAVLLRAEDREIAERLLADGRNFERLHETGWPQSA